MGARQAHTEEKNMPQTCTTRTRSSTRSFNACSTIILMVRMEPTVLMVRTVLMERTVPPVLFLTLEMEPALFHAMMVPL